MRTRENNPPSAARADPVIIHGMRNVTNVELTFWRIDRMFSVIL